MRIALLLVLASLSSCESMLPDYEAKWAKKKADMSALSIGMAEDELYRRMGPPFRSQMMSDGGKTVAYMTRWCTDTFVLSPEGVVESYTPGGQNICVEDWE
jgi:hypothetical protein